MTRYNDYIVAIYYIAPAVHVANEAITVLVHSTSVYIYIYIYNIYIIVLLVYYI